MYLNEAECKKAGLDCKIVEKIARRISKAAKEAKNLGLSIFGGSGTGTLRYNDGSGCDLIVAYLDGSIDGGDGSTNIDSEGLLRGEGEGAYKS